MTVLAGDPYPLHPDQYGRAPIERRHAESFGEMPMPVLTDAEMEAMWEQEQDFRAVVARVHTHAGCGDPCDSGACILMAGVNDPLCIRCQLAEVSDKERHREMRRKAIA